MHRSPRPLQPVRRPSRQGRPCHMSLRRQVSLSTSLPGADQSILQHCNGGREHTSREAPSIRQQRARQEGWASQHDTRDPCTLWQRHSKGSNEIATRRGGQWLHGRRQLDPSPASYPRTNCGCYSLRKTNGNITLNAHLNDSWGGPSACSSHVCILLFLSRNHLVEREQAMETA